MKLPQESKPRDTTAKILNRVDDSGDDSGGNCRLQIQGGAESHVEDDSLVPSKKNERASRDTILEILADDISVPGERDGSGVPTHPKLSSRACPKLIFQANEKYTVAQRGAVKDMGFQHILHMKVERVPTHLAYWVLDNFNANSSELTLTNGRSIPVDEEDVHLVFGFPKGGRKIQRRRKSDGLDSETTFYNQFGEMKRDRIKLKMVYDKMMEDVDGGDAFKMNFVVLLTACLIESNINGYAAAPTRHTGQQPPLGILTPEVSFGESIPMPQRYALGAPGWDDERVQSEFNGSLKLQLWRSEKHTLRNIDMFFFPVLSRDHYYIVCFDMRKREALVIDNSDEREGVDIRQQYGSAPFRLQTVFADHLYMEGLKTKSLMVRRACMARLEMSWRDTNNNNDCGVYVMRHMETYMGQSVNAWKCNLEKGNVF
ncbi:hypothetical protein C2S53_020094 [Perilla frutescens var. hirtella]|uniref:Ubiquitin-like protease family profile domain-containing protein n=1 Tax=Perilla frutescens var. hirtella TaxID=608512 RepID=A0AAD4P0J1_PERFH|nr:hypothetical protein C2S53_020094 [Perilla frutescens var. hirtella]